ncbi:hypothetical protein LSTR_LSTR003658 [Laodelphax striatellus]|uniref:Ribosome biogenesis protein NOP53 n=1 Tax=Laodelphax striatellus TaxID=195883 RepID=A0A482XAI9_LAOST|nr:hypothetical protein LSTR_LSTR003658 [Laodelphax striatellus]
MGPVKKKTKFSKKTKKAWRFTDITDVENFYEDKLHEERLGGPLAEKHDDNYLSLIKMQKINQRTRRAKRSFILVPEKRRRELNSLQDVSKAWRIRLKLKIPFLKEIY